MGLELAERGGKNGKQRAIIATARKLAVLAAEKPSLGIGGRVKSYLTTTDLLMEGDYTT
jgi:hypothetical protein